MSSHFIKVLALLLTSTIAVKSQTSFPVTSPDKNLKAEVDIENTITIIIRHDGQQVVQLADLYMEMNQHRWMGRNPVLVSHEVHNHSGKRKPVVPNKEAVIPYEYNELQLDFEGKYSLIVRAYNDGIAYRFMDNSGRNGEVIYEYSFSSKFPKYVLEAIPDTTTSPDRNQILAKTAPYIATTDGSRAYPWRVFIINDDDRALVESNLVTLLANPPTSNLNEWIKPGQVAWDWYNANILHGVDFVSGINTQTYKYYIDFAAENGIEYVILDEGWTKSTTEIMEANRDIKIREIIRYGKSRDVGIILWVLWKPLDERPEEILKLYHDWGAAGVKVDFMQRSDQYMVSSYERIAQIAHGLEMLVDFHGAFKPAGIERVWPNVITYEGVKGNENNKWSADITPEHTVTLPFIRMVAGPMDFTPGSMLNTNKKNFRIRFDRPMSMGTRAHQVAMYVVYESPLQMLCESPSVYKEEQETIDFITQIPTIWDETRVLQAAVADYIILARRKGDTWYVGAISDGSSRDFTIELSFLDDGQYEMQSYSDGINASRFAPDYEIRKQGVDDSVKVDISMASRGGWVAIIKKIDN